MDNHLVHVIIKPTCPSNPRTIFQIGTVRTCNHRNGNILADKEEQLFWTKTVIHLRTHRQAVRLDLDILPNRFFQFGFDIEIIPESTHQPIYKAEFVGDRRYRQGVFIKLFLENIFTNRHPPPHQPNLQAPTCLAYHKPEPRWPANILKW